MTDMLIILIVVMVSWLYIYMPKIAHFKNVQFILCQLYVSEAILKFHRRFTRVSLKNPRIDPNDKEM